MSPPRAYPRASSSGPASCTGIPARQSFIAPDTSTKALSIYHKLNLSLLGLTPLALVLSPSAMNMPIDIALSIFFPLHAHVGMNCVITDYAPKAFGRGGIGPCRVVMAGLTAVTTLGLLQLSLTGPGLTETIKSLWRPKQSS